MKSALIFLSLIGLIELIAAGPTSKTGPYTIEKDLSDIDHGAGTDKHNTDYDHEAFLGKDQAKKFENLTPEESMKRLKELVREKVDKNKDDKISRDELSKWIKYVSQATVRSEAKDHWNNVNKKGQAELDLDSYLIAHYGDINRIEDEKFKKIYENHRRQDSRRWRKADSNGDMKLNQQEFISFFRPEEDPKMIDIVVEEVFEGLDKDNNGVVTKDEYLLDLRSRFTEEEKKKTPEWYNTESKDFEKHRDTNKDGLIDRKEVKNWVAPDDYDHVKSETEHLMSHSDKDKDGFIDMFELEATHDHFAGSQATAYGDILKKKHEL